MKPNKVERLYDRVPHPTLERIKKHVYDVVGKLEIVEAYRTKEPVDFAHRKEGEPFEAKVGEVWGDVFDCAWMHIVGKVPSSCKGKHAVMILDVSGEGLIYDKNGKPFRGITSFNATQGGYTMHDWGVKRVVQISECSTGEEEIDIWVDCGNNDLFGNTVYENGISTYRPLTPFKCADIAICNDLIRDIYYDYVTLEELRHTLHDDNPQYYSIIYALRKVQMILNDFDEEELKEASALLKKEINKKGGTPTLNFSAVGHAHIDLAWLWPIRESKRKVARTFATQLELTKRYPGYVFLVSQPQQLQWLKEDYPSLYEEVKVAVKEGRIEPQGCMWVESDPNAPSGESLSRQILYGTKFFKEEFDKDVEALWLPDSFGFPAVLPEILAKADIKYFMTIKISWNVFTPFTHNTFIWKGTGEDTVIAHLPPEGTYNSAANPMSVHYAVERYNEKGIVDDALLIFGVGDGGAGPAPKHLENLKRMENLLGLPPVKMESSEKFFHKLDKYVPELETYWGELYLENHQGTLTSQGHNKYHNRKMELLFHDVEANYSIHNLLYGTSFPKEEIEKLWKETLLYEFHDIIPGSSIPRVYDETEVAYPRMEKQLEGYLCELYGKENDYVFNPLGTTYHDIVEKNGKYYEIDALPLGYTKIDKEKEIKEFNSKITGKTLMNDKIKARFDEKGRLVELITLDNGKNIIEKEGGNILALFDDNMYFLCGDAWDIDPEYHSMKPDYFELVDSKSYQDGPNAVLEMTFKYNKSTFIQKVLLKHGSQILEFVNEVDWHERNKMLRAEFYADVVSEFSTCGIQFGSVKRTTKINDTKDMAQCETAAHRYVSLDEGDKHFAILSECKYGYRAKGKMISLGLLRSPNWPSPEREGIHCFRYAVYAKNGESSVEEEAYKFQQHLSLASAKENFSFASVDKSNVVIETLKPAEYKEGYIIRLYENKGQKTDFNLLLNPMLKKAFLTSLIEKDKEELKIENGKITLTIKPFEVLTFRVVK